jgi:hypothetical protein
MKEVKYKVGRFGFKTKKDLIAYTKQTIDKSFEGTIIQDEEEFIFELIKFHKDKNFIDEVEGFYIDWDSQYGKNLSLWVELTNGYTRNISYLKCIDNVLPIGKEQPIQVPVPESKIDETINFVLNMGKYIGETIEDVYYTDPEYINWVLSHKFIENKTKLKFRTKRYLKSIGFDIELETPKPTYPIKHNKPKELSDKFKEAEEKRLIKAIESENFEEAARIRDILKKINK